MTDTQLPSPARPTGAPSPVPTSTAVFSADWCPRLRESVRLHTTQERRPRHLIYDTDTGAYCRITPDALALARLLDGTRSVAELSPQGEATRSKLVRFLLSMMQQRLIEPPPGVVGPSQTGQASIRPPRRWTRLQWSIGNTETFFASLRPLASLLFNPLSAVGILALLVVGALALRSVDRIVTVAVSSRPSPLVLITAAVTMAMLVLLHEAAHALALTRFGGRVNRVGLMMLYLLPAAFVDVSDVYLLPGRWRRIVVALAGVSVQLIAVSVCAIVLVATAPKPSGDIAHYLGYLIALNLSLVVVNLNPFGRFDGYWALVAALDSPNLWLRARAGFRDKARQLMLGARPVGDPGLGLAGYGLACTLVPSALIVVALAEWNLFLGGLGRIGALVWLCGLAGLAAWVARRAHRLAAELRRLPARQRARGVVIAFVGLGMLVGAAEASTGVAWLHQVGNAWVSQPLGQLLA